MTVSRRDLLRAGASAAALLAIPRPLLAQLGRAPEPLPPIEDPRLRGLAFEAVDAARRAGAVYADVRLSHSKQRSFRPDFGAGTVRDSEAMAVGVRALVSGYWGFASSAVWSATEMARLGREAVHQARSNSLGHTREVNLAEAPAVDGGHWVMPVERDPFATDIDEILDHLLALRLFAERHKVEVQINHCEFETQEKAFASSQGSYFTQRVFVSQGAFQMGRDGYNLSLDRLTPAGLGWELYTGQPLRDAIRKLAEEIDEDLGMPVKPVDVGRYDTVLNAQGVTALLDATLGRATELDRAMGYEANASGTSFVTEPLETVGTIPVGGSLVAVRGDRSTRGGAATVQWDDEGVRPDDFEIVDKGVLVDFQTTRESAGWLAAYYGRRGTPVRSHGCAAAHSAMEVPLTRAPNLSLASGVEQLDFEGLVAQLDKGLAIKNLGVDMDFQQANGVGGGRTYQIQNGKRVARVGGASILFSAPALWKTLAALGGASSVRRFGKQTRKGEPAQTTYHSVSAPPARFTQVSVIDARRKA